jgi:hypothetical protein
MHMKFYLNLWLCPFNFFLMLSFMEMGHILDFSVIEFIGRMILQVTHFNDWLIIYGFTSRSRIFHLYGDITITGEGLQNLGLCSALRAFEQGGIFIVPHLLWHRVSVFPVSSEVAPIQSPFMTHKGMWRIWSILAQIFMGPILMFMSKMSEEPFSGIVHKFHKISVCKISTHPHDVHGFNLFKLKINKD